MTLCYFLSRCVIEEVELYEGLEGVVVVVAGVPYPVVPGEVRVKGTRAPVVSFGFKSQ